MKIFKRVLISFAFIIIGLIVLRYIYIEEMGNFHEVSKAMVYRSAQLDKDELLKFINKYGIRSILNLRGKKEDKQWYRDEVMVAKSKGVMMLTFHLSPKKIISPSTLTEIIDLMKKAPKPILIHCKAGADRSGLIAAVWKLAVDKEPPDKAYKQLSLFYGHVPYLWSKTKAMDESFWNYVKYLKSRKLGERDAKPRDKNYTLAWAPMKKPDVKQKVYFSINLDARPKPHLMHVAEGGHLLFFLFFGWVRRQTPIRVHP